MRIRLAAVVLTTASAFLSGCENLLDTPAPTPPSSLVVSLSVSPAAQLPFTFADRFHLTVAHTDSVLYDGVVPFPLNLAEVRIRIPLVLEEDTEELAVTVEMKEGEDTLGTGQQTVTVRRGESTEAALTIVPRPYAGPVFVLIPPGTFQMGSTNGFANEQPVHTVTLTRAFWIQTTEVTQRQWREVMGNNPSYFSSCGDDCPVEQVSWDDIQLFIRTLNAANPGADYRLPTEAEWEYAARAGTTGDFGGSGLVDEMAWYVGNSSGVTHRVHKKRANAWGLCDMHGNVAEWVEDRYSDTYYSVSPASDPQGPSTGVERVIRGGTFNFIASSVRSATRKGFPPFRSRDGGFRLARTP